MKKDSRGFITFTEFKDSYGGTVRVKESSSASKPHLWLFVDEDHTVMTKSVAGEAGAHLTLAQAKKLSAALLKACAEHYQVKPR